MPTSSQKVKSNSPMGKGITRKYRKMAQTTSEVAMELMILFMRPCCPRKVMRTKRNTLVPIAKPMTCIRKRYPMHIPMAITIRKKPCKSIRSVLGNTSPLIALTIRITPQRPIRIDRI